MAEPQVVTQHAINELRRLSSESRDGFTAAQRWMELAYRLHKSIRRKALKTDLRSSDTIQLGFTCSYCHMRTRPGEKEMHTDGCMAQADLLHLFRSINGPFAPWRPV